MHASSAPGLRWLVVARLADSPSGRTLSLADALDQLGFTTRVDLGPTLGAAGPLTVDLAFPRLSSYAITGVLTASPLAELTALSQRLGGPPSKCPAPAELLATVARITGDGSLHAGLAALFAEPAAPLADPPASTSGGDLVAELLARSTAPAPDRAAEIVQSLIRSAQPAKSATKSGALRAARDRLDAALGAAARAALDDPAVRAREALWRSLKLLYAQTPRDAGPKVSVLDADLDGLAALYTALADDDPMDRPDAIFLAEPVTDIAQLSALAGQSAAILVPLVVSLAPAILGRPDLTALASLDDEPAQIPAAWTELRADDDARWLSAAVNQVALVSESGGAGRRVVFGPAGLALAALLSASHRDTGGLASLARPGVVRAPANWEPTTGPDAGTSIPTERFAALRAQARLAALGLTAIGSPRGGDSIVVAACPTLHAGEDAVSLPAQILTGRIVRFAFWALAQVPAGSTASDVETLFTQAAGVFLFPDLQPEAASLRASVDKARNEVSIAAFVHPAIAGARLDIQFALALRVDLS